MEMAELVKSNTPEYVNSKIDPMREVIENNPKDHIHIKGSTYEYHLPNGRIYFRKENGKVKELSHVTANNEHMLTSKGENGDSTHIHNFMKHHIEKYGHLYSTTQNTEGSKNMWLNFHKNNPQYSYSIYNKGKKIEDIKEIPKDFWYDPDGFENNKYRRDHYLRVDK